MICEERTGFIRNKMKHQASVNREIGNQFFDFGAVFIEANVLYLVISSIFLKFTGFKEVSYEKVYFTCAFSRINDGL